MKCRETKTRLSLYLDDLLDLEESSIIREHLEACESCSQEILELQKIKNALRSIKTVKAPDSLLRSINERIDQKNDVSVFGASLKKTLDFLTMRHAVEAAGVFAVTAVIVIIFLPSVKNSMPSIEAPEEKSPFVYQKPLHNKLLKSDSPSSPVPMDRLKAIAKTIPKRKALLKDSNIGAQKISPVIISFALKARDNKYIPLERSASDDVPEVIRSEKKMSSIPAGKSDPQKAKQYITREYSAGSGNLSESDYHKSAPTVVKEKKVTGDIVFEIKKIAGEFGAAVKKLQNKNRLVVTIQGTKLKAFLNRLNNIGSVRIMQKNFSDWPGLVKIYINYE